MSHTCNNSRLFITLKLPLAFQNLLLSLLEFSLRYQNSHLTTLHRFASCGIGLLNGKEEYVLTLQ